MSVIRFRSSRIAVVGWVLLLCAAVRPLPAVNVWTGKSADWAAGENWSLGAAPKAADKNDVRIPGGLAQYPALAADAVVDGSLTVEPGGVLSLNGRNLSLSGLSGGNQKGVVVRGRLDAGPGAPTVTVGRGGFVNTGTVSGTVALVFAGQCNDAVVQAGGAELASLSLPRGSWSYAVTLRDALTVRGDVVIAGHRLVVDKAGSLTIRGNLVFSGSGKQTASMAVNGPAVLHGNIVADESPICAGDGGNWLTLAGAGNQTISSGGAGVLPPLRIAKPSGTAAAATDFACAGLRIEKGSSLDLSACRTLTFGGGGSYSADTRGLVNEGAISGTPALVFSTGCYNAKLAPGGFVPAGLALDTGNYAYSATLVSDLSVAGDVVFKTGSFNMGDLSLSIGGSLLFPRFPAEPSPQTFCLRSGKKAAIVFTGKSPAVLESAGVKTAHYFDATLPALTVDKPGGVLEVRTAPVDVRGVFAVKNGRLAFADGGALWLGVVRDSRYAHYGILDVGLKIASPVTAEELPPIVPAPVPEHKPGIVTRVENRVGPEPPASLKTVNIASDARVTTVPYVTMARHLTDPDEDLRTCPTPEQGTPAGSFRYDFAYDTPQTIAGVEWAVPSGPWAIMADMTGSGSYDRLLRADFEGKIANPGGIWKSRAWIRNSFQPPIKGVRGIRIVTFKTPYYYDVRILVPRSTAKARPETAPVRGVSELARSETMPLPQPPPGQGFLKGFHIEPWMFAASSWLAMDKAKRPPLAEFKPFVDFAANVRKYHGNVVNMWPPKTFGTPRGKGTYELDLLWPSRYDKWSIAEDALKEIANAFRANGISLFTMDRAVYPKKLEEFPPSPTRDLPAPYFPRHSREFLKGFVLEQVAQGVDGVGLGYDEQMGWFRAPSAADDVTKAAFKERHKVEIPAQAEDTEAYRRWILFGYEQFGSYLGEAGAAAKAANPKVSTKTPTHMALGCLWNRRIDLNIAEDIVCRAADIDFVRANAYEDYTNLGHYIAACSTKRMLAANRGRGPDSLHNCPWANDPQKFPGYYLDTTPSYMSGPPVSSIMNGGRLPMYWRYNFIFYGGYDVYVEQAYSIIDTLGAWGATAARTPGEIVVLKSRASEDWWQVRQRYNPEGNPLDQTRGFLYEKWVMEFLLSNGYPFRLHYLDHPEDFADSLRDAAVVILPFPYSIGREAFDAVRNAAARGAKVLVFDRRGETDELGNAYEKPLFEEMIAAGTARFVGDDVPAVGHHRAFIDRMRGDLDRLLGERKVFSFEPYGSDVEFACLERSAREKILCYINWSSSPSTVDAGVRLPAGSYEALQRDMTTFRRLKAGSRAALTAADLAKFRVSLAPWEIKAIRIAPAAGD